VGIGGLGLNIRLLALGLPRGLKKLHRMLRLLGKLIRGLRGDRLVLDISMCPLGHYTCSVSDTTLNRQCDRLELDRQCVRYYTRVGR